MKKFLFIISILAGIFFYLPTYAAVAYDTSTNFTIGAAATSHTFSYTTTGSNTFLLVGVLDYSDPDTNDISSITYDGSTMTQQVHAINFGGSYDIFLYYIPVGAGKTANVVINFNNSTNRFRALAISYSGAAQSGFPEVTNNSAGTSSSNTVTRTLTTLTDGAWVGMLADNEISTFTAGANTTGRAGVYTRFFDSNAAISPAGSATLIANHSTGFNDWGIIYTINPFVASSAIIPENDIIIFD